MKICRFVLVFLVFGSLLITQAVLAQDCEKDSSAEKTADINKLLEITGSKEMGQQVFSQVIDSFKASMPQVPSAFWAEVKKEVDMDGLMEIIVPIYDCHLKHEDIKATIAFYESPAGQNFVQAMPAITAKAMAAGQKWGLELGQKVAEKLQKSGY